MAKTIFDKILSGDLPSETVYENKQVLAFLDIAPVAEGHTLVIHKKDRSAELSKMKKRASTQLMHAVQDVMKLLKDKLGATGINVLLAEGSDAGQEVMHAHVHLIPRYKDDGLHLHNVAAKAASEESLQSLAKQLRD